MSDGDYSEQVAPVGEVNPLQRATGRLCACGCGKPLEGKQARWSCEAHRWKAWDRANPRQRALPGLQPVPPVVDQRVPEDESPALKGHNALVLARLRRGPATGADLERLLGPGSAWRTRVSDCRRWLESRGETVRTKRIRPRVYVYSIEAKP